MSQEQYCHVDSAVVCTGDGGVKQEYPLEETKTRGVSRSPTIVAWWTITRIDDSVDCQLEVQQKNNNQPQTNPQHGWGPDSATQGATTNHDNNENNSQPILPERCYGLTEIPMTYPRRTKITPT